MVSVNGLRVAAGSGLSVVEFWSSWDEGSVQMEAVMAENAKLNPVIQVGGPTLSHVHCRYRPSFPL